MKNTLAYSAAIMAVLTSTASAAVTGFSTNPTGNSVDWSTSVSGLGGAVNSSVDFEAHGPGPLNGSFYSGQGVTLTTSSPSSVVFGTGPSQSNVFSTPLSPGEGPHAASHYLFLAGAPQSLTISFTQAVLGVGLYTIDRFGIEAFSNNLSLSIFDGPNGTGSLLGTVSAENFNFQQDNLYFMGFTSGASDIQSAVLNWSSDASGDEIGLDNIVYATGSGAVPEPTTVIGASALFALAAARVLRKRIA